MVVRLEAPALVVRHVERDPIARVERSIGKCCDPRHSGSVHGRGVCVAGDGELVVPYEQQVVTVEATVFVRELTDVILTEAP